MIENYSSKKIHSNFPLKLGMGYIIFTLTLFYIGPMDWPFISMWPVLFYMIVLGVATATFFNVGLKKSPKQNDLKSRNTILLIGGLSSILLLYPTAQIYTGRAPWEVLQALSDQREAYSKLREQLELTQDSRGLMILARALFGPFMFAVLPLGILCWRNLSTATRFLFIGTILSSMILSVLRGTTRELADLVIVGGAAFLISIYRQSKTMPRFSQHWPKIVAGCVLTLGVLAALTGRVEARLGGSASSLCIGGGYVCANYDGPVYRDLPPIIISAIGSLTGYLSQGYYGLSLALQHDFVPTWGLGHSPIVGSLYRMQGGDAAYLNSTYIERLNQDAWSSDSHWSTAATWLASDVSFWGVPIILAFIGYLWGRSWVDAVYGVNDKAAVFFCVIMMMIFYFPANNQMMGTLEAYLTTLFWGFFWTLSRHESSAPPKTPGILRA